MNFGKEFRVLAVAAGVLLAAVTAFGQDGDNAGGYSGGRGSYSGDRSAYSYIRGMTGEATINSRLNGSVEARRNMPISVGDEISVSQAGRVEVGLADGNVIFLGGGTRASFDSLHDQQGEQDQFSAIQLIEGEVVLSGLGSNDSQIPRIDTDDATVYISRGSHVRVNADPRRGTVVVGRAGSVEVRTRAGTYTVKAGQYLIARGDEEPEIARGSFSRDRFDLWVADRLESINGDDTRSASVRYVGDQYASDVVALDGYGDWEYDSGYGGQVWSPRVDADWSPYSYGSWYYTNAGLTWWSYDPWGWYPFHYGNWFYARNHWCWAPGYAYSPAWVYWGYSGGYVGWCPTGYYSFWSPWWNNYYRQVGFSPRSSLYFAINGNFDCRRVDFRGWNFVNSGSFGTTVTRASVIPGSRIADRLGSQVAISSRPIVVNPREGGVREAIRSFVREAPRTIERASAGSERLAPVLARERTLPAETVAALRERAVVAERGRLSGPAAAEIAPRGAIVERSRTAPSPGFANREPATVGRGFATERAERAERTAPDTIVRDRGTVTGPDRSNSWRSRGGVATGEAREISPRERSFPAEHPSSPSRERSFTTERPSSVPPTARADSWRSRPEAPPAQRVIEGAVPGHRAAEPRSESWRGREFRPEQPSYRGQPSFRERVDRVPVDRSPSYSPPARIERAPAPETVRPHFERPNVDRAPYSPPQPRFERPNVDRAPYSPPAPRMERQIERPAYAPPPPARVERAPQPPPQQAPRAESRHESRERPAPAERGNRERPH